MAQIFISYRRSDDGWAGRIETALKQRLSSDEIFRDVNSIPKGADFPTDLENNLKESAVVLILIGSGWVSELAIERLADSEDYVRREIELAFKLDKKVFVINIKNTSIPPDDLPDSIKKVVSINFTLVRDTDFDRDMSDLAGQIREATKKYNTDRIYSKLHGFRGLLNIALRAIDGSSTVTEGDFTNLAKVFITDQMEENEKLTNFEITMDDDIDRTVRLLEGVSYKKMELPNDSTVQIGIISGTSRNTLLLYEQYDATRQNVNSILIEYFFDYPFQIENKLSVLLSESKQPSISCFRFPYQIYFRCKISPRQHYITSYSPYKSDLAFSMERLVWGYTKSLIGSGSISLKTVENLHDELYSLSQFHTVIHATEQEQQTLL